MMDRRQRSAELYGLGISTKQATGAAASVAMAVPGAGLPVAMAIELAPLAVNELIHPIREFKHLKQDIFGIFGHRSHDAAANAQEARLRGNDYRLLTLMTAMYLPAVRAAKSDKVAKVWNSLVTALARKPVAWADLGTLRHKVEHEGVPELEKLLQGLGVLPRGTAYSNLAFQIRAKNMATVQAMFKRDQGGHAIGWKVLSSAMAAAMRGMAALSARLRTNVHAAHATTAAPVTHAASTTHATAAARTTSDAQIDALRKKAAAAIAVAKALESRVAAGDSAARPAYAGAYRRAQELIVQTRTAQAAAPAAATVTKKKSPAAMIGWLAAGAGVLDLARRFL